MTLRNTLFGLLLTGLAANGFIAQSQSQRRRVTIEDVITLPEKDLPPATAVISGTVVSETTARPLVGATVALTRHFDKPLLALLAVGAPVSKLVPVLTDAQGRFLFKDLPEGDYGFIVQMDGYLERKLGESTEEGKLTKVTVASGQHVEGLQIAIIQSARIRGRVRDESGLPLGNFPVQLFLPDNVESVVAKVNSGPDGSFDLIGFLPGTFVLVAGSVLSEDPLGSFAATVVASTPDVVLQDVSLSRARYGIRGTVTFKETSKPPADVRVTITSAPRAGLRMADLIEPPASYDLTSGSFEIPSLSPGFYRLDGRLPENLPTCGAINVVVSSRDVSGVPLIVTQCAPGN